MHKRFVILIAASLLMMGNPAAQAGETVEEDYLLAVGARIMPLADNDLPSGIGILLCPGGYWFFQDDWDPVNDPLGDDQPHPCDYREPVVPHVGGTDLWAEGGAYSNIVITPSDDVFGSNAAMQTCLWDPDVPHYTCGLDGAHHGSDAACGSVNLTGADFLATLATAFIYNFMVTSDFDVCGGTSGSVVGDFF